MPNLKLSGNLLEQYRKVARRHQTTARRAIPHMLDVYATQSCRNNRPPQFLEALAAQERIAFLEAEVDRLRRLLRAANTPTTPPRLNYRWGNPV